jgi:hypothetical protein
MKKIIIFYSLFFSSIVFSQKLKYSGGILKANQKNYGKNVTVDYDSFFDSYVISYTNMYGNRLQMRYEGSQVQVIQAAPNLFFISIHGTGYFISNLKKSK